MSKGQYIQYGCGFSAPSQWKNFDASPTLRFERLPLIGGLYTRNKSRFPDDVELEDAGFVSIRRAVYGDYEDPMFEAVEDEGRWTNCLGVECRKP